MKKFNRERDNDAIFSMAVDEIYSRRRTSVEEKANEIIRTLKSMKIIYMILMI